MKKFRPFLINLFVSLFVFCSVGVFLPLKSFAQTQSTPLGDVSLTYPGQSWYWDNGVWESSSHTRSNVFSANTSAYSGVDDSGQCSFDFSMPIVLGCSAYSPVGGSNVNSIPGTLNGFSFQIYAFYTYNGSTDSTMIFEGSFNLPLGSNSYSHTYTGQGTCPGVLIGMSVEYSMSYTFRSFDNSCRANFSLGVGTANISNVVCEYDLPDPTPDDGKVSYSPEVISSNGLMATNGFSPMTLGMNSTIYSLGGAYSYDNNYGYSAFNVQYDLNISSGQLNLYTGPDINRLPIAFLGDCRKGTYQIAFGYVADLGTNPSFNFDSGWTGELVFGNTAICSFSDSSWYTVHYRAQHELVNDLWYVNVFLTFNAPDTFDSVIIRTAPTVYNIKAFAFCLNKYVGTIADQLVQSQEHWDNNLSGTQAFQNQNQSATSTMSSFETSEADYFSDYETQVEATGIDNFDLAVLADNLYFVKLCIDTVYNVLPDILQYVLFTALVFGAMGAILGTLHYVAKNYVG